MADDDAKAKLYKQVVQKANEQTVLQQMRIYGFWPWHDPIPADPPDEAAERVRIDTEIIELQKTQQQAKDPKKALAEERKRRWDESKKRRAEAKVKREQEQQQRREAWTVLRQSTLVHAGVGYSGGLPHILSDVAKLTSLGLPLLHTSTDLATAMGITLASLRWLTYHRRGATLVHYHRYGIAKKTGGVRYISAPKAALKHAQGWVYANILARLPVESPAHGFVPTRSIVTNAVGHVNRAVVVNMDMKDFFPSITFRRVKGLFESMGYSEHAATVLALLCTEPPRVAAELDGKIYYIALGQRVLPQGASTSPAITNLLCRKLDRRLAGLARKHGFAYTRYADDLTFSGDHPTVVGRLLRSVRAIVQAEGFIEHPTKTRVMRQANHQEVTGVTVNVRPTIARDKVRVLRAILQNAKDGGLAQQNRDNDPHFIESLRGQIAFVCMVDPQRGLPLQQAFAELLSKK
jgi:retron-type reverse transcriptase